MRDFALLQYHRSYAVFSVQVNGVKCVAILFADAAWATAAVKALGMGPYPGEAVNTFHLHADWSSSSVGISTHHSGRANIGFADGHVESRTAGELRGGAMPVKIGINENGTFVEFK